MFQYTAIDVIIKPGRKPFRQVFKFNLRDLAANPFK